MHVALRLTLLAAGLLVCAGRVNAQEPEYYNIPPPELRYTITVEREQEAEGEAVTLVKLRGALIQKADIKGALDLSSLLTYDAVAHTLRRAQVTFQSEAPRCRFAVDAPTTVIIDGETTRLDGEEDAAAPGEGTAWTSRVQADGKCYEDLILNITPQFFLKLANAGGVEVQTGRFRFGLPESALKTLRELAGKSGL